MSRKNKLNENVLVVDEDAKTVYNVDSKYTVYYGDWDFTPIYARQEKPTGTRITPLIVAKVIAMVSSTGLKVLAAKMFCAGFPMLWTKYFPYCPLAKEAYEEAEEYYTDLIENEASRRGFDGYEEPVFYKGEECGSITKYSDTLALALLKKRRPSFRDSSSATEEQAKQGGVVLIKETVTDSKEWAQRYTK